MKQLFSVLKIGAILLLLFAVAGHPPRDFYMLLRICICLISLGSAIWALHLCQAVWIGLFAIIAIVFNPLIPFYLHKSTWKLIDLASAAVFAVSLFFDYFSQQRMDREPPTQN